MLFTISTWAQTRVITGQIIGGGKDTLIGAVVSQKGAPSNATSTDINGNFSLNVSDSGNVVLIVQSTGYKDKEIAVGDNNQVNIAMDEDRPEKEEEVVVIGYGTVKKSDLTGAVVSLKPKEVKEVPSGNLLDAVQGKVAGADIVTTSGQAGQNPNITIRGNRSITASNGPLYVVDGMQYSSIQDINPNDIISMEVLKDASSTAIYGSRGANGVIIVTTKRGAAGETKVSLNSYVGISDVLAFPKPMNAQQYADLKLEAYKAQNPGDPNPTYQTALGGNYTNYANGMSTDYRSELLHKGVQKDIQIGVSGGTDKMRTYFSLDYFNQKGLLAKDILNRYTGRLNVDYQIKKFLKIGTQTQITYYDQSKRVNPLGNASKILPISEPFDANGNIIIMPGVGGNTANPLIDEQPSTAVDNLSTLRVFPTIYAELKPLKDLSIRTNLAVNWDHQGEGIFFAANSLQRLNDGFASSLASHESQFSRQLNWQGVINYNKTIKKDHSVTATALSEIITNKTEDFYLQSTGQLIPDQLYYNLADGTAKITSSSYSKKVLISFAGRLNYSYKSKYLLTVTARSDGSSVLAEGHKWAFFPSVAGAWKISEEKFMQSESIKKVLSSVKLRGSWGVAGNSNISPYATQSTLNRIPFTYDQTTANAYTLNPQIGNKGTKWETSSTWDIGLDLGVLKERITLSADYYNTGTNNLLLTQKLPLSTGVTQTVSNVGATTNKGFELTATSVNVQSKKITWSNTITFMLNREKVTKLVDNLENMQITLPNGSTKYIVVGSPVSAFFDYEKVGIWQSTDSAEAAGFGQKPGNIHIKDQNGDGSITTADRVVVGSTVPKWSGGYNCEFKIFNNIDLSFFLFARIGSTINYQYTYDYTGVQNSLSTREYWTPSNPTNDLPRPGLTIPSQFSSTLRYTNGSFLKLRSATIGYSVPSSFLKKLHVSRLRFYITGKNLLVKSKIKDYDPEMQGSLTFPTVRLFVGGINLDF
jgi:TonB-linked SusC/RagA family outer membrane protein